jgi:transcription termination factor NusB
VSTVVWLPNEREEADWITLEVAYRVTRNRLIAAHRSERDANAVDIVELEAQINGIKTQLSSMQSMKVNSSRARELISGVRESLDTLESEIRSHLTRMEETLQASDEEE